MKTQREIAEQQLLTLAGKMAETFGQVAKEDGRFELAGDRLYYYASEVATLRLFKAYHDLAAFHGVSQGYSDNLGTFYFARTITNPFAAGAK